MANRRTFIRQVLGLTAATLLGRVSVSAAAPTQSARRIVTIDGRRVRTIDVHAHCVVREVLQVAKDPKVLAAAKEAIERPQPLGLGPERIRAMDEQGIDVQALSVNAFWYGMGHREASEIVKVQNETIARWCKTHPDRFVGLASVALQDPQSAAEQLTDAVKRLGMRGVAIGGSVEGEELAAPKFDPFWAAAAKLGVLIFMHPQPATGTTENPRLAGKGRLDNLVGNPLETTVFLSHLIFEGTLDRFPGLRICASHGGGYIASYSGRSDALCGREQGVECRSLKKKPSEYFKREIFADTIIFSENGLHHLVRESGARQIMYGTDYPFDWPVGVDFVLNASFLSSAEKEAILGGNAARLLRI